MTTLFANCSKKGQMKIQEMAFVLVAVMVFFGLAVLFYITIRMAGMKDSATMLQQNEAMEMVKKLAASPEFAWTANDCSNCVDMDKLMAIKNMTEYRNFWGLDYLKVERIYPQGSGECTKQNYPDCQSITLVPAGNFGTPPFAFVSLCRYDFKDGQSYKKCDIGKIYATKKVNK